MVQIKQKSNKINITAFVACFVLILLFMFGCVQYAFASDKSDVDKAVSSSPGQYYLVVLADHVNGSKNCLGAVSMKFDTNNMPSRVCGVVKADGTMNSGYSIWSDVKYTGSYSFYSSWSQTGGSPNDNKENVYSSGGATAYSKILEYKTNVILFGNDDDAATYIKTGQINNAVYQPKEVFEYDESVELPLSVQCQVNGDLFLFNCKQSVAHSDYTIQLSADCRLTPVYSNFASKSYADTKQSYRTNKNEIGKYNNHGISFNTSFSTSDLLNGVDTSRKALGFKEFYNGIYINLPYEKCTLSEIVFYARNICGNKCSNWVRVTYDLVSETSKYEEVESVTGSDIPSDTKHNNSEYYPDDYLYNDDEAFNSGFDVTNTLTNLKTNYTSLISFYKNLFSFLPSEVWVLLIGLVGAMVILALIIFIRG